MTDSILIGAELTPNLPDFSSLVCLDRPIRGEISIEGEIVSHFDGSAFFSAFIYPQRQLEWQMMRLARPHMPRRLFRRLRGKWKAGETVVRWDVGGHIEPALPDDLFMKGGHVMFECRLCGEAAIWPGEIEQWDQDDVNNLCGGSPRCCP